MFNVLLNIFFSVIEKSFRGSIFYRSLVPSKKRRHLGYGGYFEA